MSHLREFGEGLWTMEGDTVRTLGIPFQTRMTVARLASGGLWVLSPIALTPARRAVVEALGPVEHIVAPNKIHSLGIAPWKKLYSAARIWVSPGFTKRHSTLPVDETLGDEAPQAWRDEIEQVIFRGNFFLDEVVFHHGPSRTVIFTDLIQRHDPDRERAFWRMAKKLAGVLGPEGGTARDLRAAFRDRAAARRSLEKVLDWDFDRVVIAHGLCAASDGRDLVKRAFSWLQ